MSLTGRYERFGTQAAQGLRAWQELDGNAELIIEDDMSSPDCLVARLPIVARNCDVLLGPYSTQLTRVAARLLPELDCIAWNHGGSGDDVERACPGRLLSVLAPTSRYAEPFVTHLADEPRPGRLWIVQGKESFGRQVALGAEATARRFGLPTMRVDSVDLLPGEDVRDVWDLFTAGAFEEDIAIVTAALNRKRRPRAVCSVAAGVGEFVEYLPDVVGIFGIVQWFPGRGGEPDLGPSERDFLDRYSTLTRTTPDYPAVQAAAAAVLGAHCQRLADDPSIEAVWRFAAGLRTCTLFGHFKIDPVTGRQIGHETVLVRWSAEGLRTA